MAGYLRTPTFLEKYSVFASWDGHNLTQPICAPLFFSRKMAQPICARLFFLRKMAQPICAPLFLSRKMAQSICAPLFFSRNMAVLSARPRFSQEIWLFYLRRPAGPARPASQASQAGRSIAYQPCQSSQPGQLERIARKDS